MSLRADAVSGVVWVALDRWGRQLLTFAVFLMLARLLAKHDFGLVALASLYLGFVQMFVTQGLGAAIIQKKGLTPAHLDAAFWVSMSAALVLGVLTAVFRDAIAGVLGEAAAGDVLGVLVITLPLAAVSVVPSAILTREMRFKAVTLLSTFASACGAVVGVAGALGHVGVWALVGQQVVTAGVASLLLWLSVSWRPGNRMTRDAFWGLAAFGLGVLGNDVLWFFSQRIDHAVIARRLGAEALAEYAVAMRVLALCIEVVVAPAQNVALPVFAKIQRDQGSLARAYIRSTALICALGIPAFTGLALVTPRLVPLAFGMKWQAVVLPLQILCCAGVVLVAQTFVHPMFMALGRPGIYTALFALVAATNTVGALSVGASGVVAVAAAITASYVVTGIVNLYVIGRYVGVGIGPTVRPLMPIVVSCVGLIGVVVGADFALKSLVNDAVVIVAQCLGGAIAYSAVLAVTSPALWGELVGVARALRGRSLDIVTIGGDAR
jgi:O-antigen/teichoic acid export membrane protein